jgi:hypothetical protein
MLLLAKQPVSTSSVADECLICLESQGTMVVLSCSHTLCSACTKQWVNRKRNCPFCRLGFTRRNVKSSQWDLVEFEVQNVQGDLQQLEESISTSFSNLSEAPSHFLDGYVSKGCAPLLVEENDDEFVLVG